MTDEKKGLTLNQETMDVLVANIIPTTKYFESRFDHMQYQIDEIKNNQGVMQEHMDKRFDSMQNDMDKRFDSMQNDMDKRFDAIQKDMDKRFEQVDKRFEQVDKRFEQINENIMVLTLRIEELSKSQETTIRDYIIERDRFYDKKFNNLRMFNLTIIAVVAGIILRMAGIINI
ncbi:MAG: hypothetical protein DRG24_09895 [Epsilonproteobacteria bacterium]|nr:MAG: hypothetical protein DRG24_09895 [Campylobacterota bacterium]